MKWISSIMIVVGALMIALALTTLYGPITLDWSNLHGVYFISLEAPYPVLAIGSVILGVGATVQILRRRRNRG